MFVGHLRVATNLSVGSGWSGTMTSNKHIVYHRHGWR